MRRLVRDACTDADLAAIVARAVRAARAGDDAARRWLFDRLGGRPRVEVDDERAALDLGELDSLEGCANAQRMIVAATTSGTLTLDHAARLTELVSATSERLEAVELRDRIEALEALAPSAES